MRHLLVESDSQSSHICNVDLGAGPKRFPKGHLTAFFSSNGMGRYTKKLEADGYLDELLSDSDFKLCMQAFSGGEMHRAIEEDAKAAWKMLIHSSRASIGLTEFTEFVNQQFHRDYKPTELTSILDALKTQQT